MWRRKLSYKHSEETDFENLMKLYDKFQVPVASDKEKAWQRFLNAMEINNNLVFQQNRSLKPLFYLAAAIILIIIGVSGFMYASREMVIECPNAQTQLITLPDGSSVNLNAASIIRYKSWRWKNNRQINLTGEAFFKVVKGKRFQVHTVNGSITVLGTSFNVYARNGKLTVVCNTGKVKVEAANTVVLLPGSKASSEKNRLLTEENQVNNRDVSWQQGEFWYNNSLVTDVFPKWNANSTFI